MRIIDKEALIKGLKNFRLEKGYTLQEMADYCEYTPQYIFKFEAGNSNSMDLLLKYIQLGFNIKEFTHEI